MNWRNACIWTSWALLPMSVLLIAHGSSLGWLYGTAAAVAHNYHWSEQQRFYRLDHALAWLCIGANCWLAWFTHNLWATIAGVFAVLLAVQAYRRAHVHPAGYDEHHTVWHIWCGLAGWCLAWGYVR